jgi:hypothetical protein
MEESVVRIAGEFFARGRQPTGTTVFFEALPSLGATMAVEIVAAGR